MTRAMPYKDGVGYMYTGYVDFVEVNHDHLLFLGGLFGTIRGLTNAITCISRIEYTYL